MARRSFENRYATAMTTASPNSPVNRCIGSLRSAYDFENQFTALRRIGRNAEGVFDQLGGFFDVVFTRVVEAAQDAPGIHLLAYLHFEDNAHGGGDGIFLWIAAPAPPGPRLARIIGLNRA